MRATTRPRHRCGRTGRAPVRGSAVARPAASWPSPTSSQYVRPHDRNAPSGTTHLPVPGSRLRGATWQCHPVSPCAAGHRRPPRSRREAPLVFPSCRDRLPGRDITAKPDLIPSRALPPTIAGAPNARNHLRATEAFNPRRRSSPCPRRLRPTGALRRYVESRGAATGRRRNPDRGVPNSILFAA